MVWAILTRAGEQTSLFEELIASTVDTCKDIPTQIALTGKIDLSRSQINMQIGELFILRINIHLNGSVLDTPELFWVEPQLKPVYQAVRSYLEMDQRVELVTERLDVIADLLAVLKDQLSHGHDEKLEWIGESGQCCAERPLPLTAAGLELTAPISLQSLY